MTEKDELQRETCARLLDCLDDLDNRKDDLRTWTDSLEELSVIEDAFKARTEVKKKRSRRKKFNLNGKTILDVGTDCVKPLYIALKFKPKKIIGINENLHYSFASDLVQKSRVFVRPTEIHLYDCSLFDDEGIKKTLGEEVFDFVLVSKTLHHLRTGKCVLHEREEHKCRDDEKCCINKFKEKEIFEGLLDRAKERVIVYEWFDPNEEDDDKVRGRGGYFTVKEWGQMLKHLCIEKKDEYRVEFVRPLIRHLDENGLDEIIAKLRQVDCVCFYVEAK